MFLSPYKIVKYQLYLFQLENYELGRYLKLLWKKGFWPKGEQRKNLVWTVKVRGLFILSVLTHFFIPVAIFLYLSHGLSVFSIKYLVLGSLVFISLFYLYFILFTLYIILLFPLDWLVKKIIIYKAKLKIQKLKNSKISIIGIAGSYGKTTMKEVLRQVLSAKFKVLSTKDSVNTPVGIARFILTEVSNETEIIILEMGEHYRGDIKDICKIIQPNIVVVTGINEAHLERMGSEKNVIATIFEIVENAKQNSLCLLNGEDKNIVVNYKNYVLPKQEIKKFQISNFKFQKFNTEGLYWECEVEGLGQIKINLLGEYALGDVDCAIKIASELRMTNEEIKLGIQKIKPVEHRLLPMLRPDNILVIDDAYNGNSAGVKEAIKVLGQFKNRRKIYITPGLVETGSVAESIHIEIGKQLAVVADVVILIKNSVTRYIELGINESSKYQVASSKGGKPEVLWFNTANEAHTALSYILKPNDVILFQNDWGDQYL